MRKDDILIVDRDLNVVAVSDLLLPFRPGFELPVQEVPANDSRERMALCQDGTLTAGGVYPSSADDGSFYLPSYQLRVLDGRHTTGLHFLPGSDPSGPLARLDVELVEVAPPSPQPLTRIAHDVVVRLAYQPPVESDGAAVTSPVLIIELGALVPQGGGVGRLEYPLFSKPDLDRMFSVMSDPRYAARLELQISASVGRRTWRQVWKRRFDAEDAAELLSGRQLVVADLQQQEPVVMLPKIRPIDPRVEVEWPLPPLWPPGLDLPIQRMARPRVPLPERMDAEPRFEVDPEIDDPEPRPRPRKPPVRPAPVPAPAPQVTPPVFERAQDSTVFVPDFGTWGELTLQEAGREQLRKVFETSDLDVVWPHPGKVRPAIPTKPIVTDHGVPALVRVTLSCTATVDPFLFDPAVNANVFDLPGDMRPEHAHVLIRDQLDLGTGVPVTVYQDSAFREQFYVEPQSFRLSRSDQPPHLPDLRMLFLDVAQSSETDGTATLDYRVQLSYRVVPTLEGAAMERLRQRLAASQPGASVSLIAPKSLELSLLLPGDDGIVPSTPRAVDPTTFDDGISDQLILDAITFQRVMAMLTGGSLDGTVSAELLASQRTSVPLRVSLSDSSDVTLPHAYRGPVEPGTVRVRVHNPLDSPVRLEALFRVSLPGGAHAYPVTDPGLVIVAGGVADVDYRLVPPDADVADVPPAVAVTVLPDPAALIPQLMVNQGYASTTFDVEVSAPTARFGQPLAPSADPLTGITVEFDDGSSTTLVDDSVNSVALRMRLLPWLLGPEAADADAARRWSYRVRNVYGGPDGTQHLGPWSALTDAQGSSILRLEPNPA